MDKINEKRSFRDHKQHIIEQGSKITNTTLQNKSNQKVV